MFHSHTIRNVLIAVVLVVVIAAAYVFFVKNGEVESVTVELSSESQASRDTAEIRTLLRELEAIKIDTGFFSSNILEGLEDLHREILPEPKGRENPFAPVS